MYEHCVRVFHASRIRNRNVGSNCYSHHSPPFMSSATITIFRTSIGHHHGKSLSAVVFLILITEIAELPDSSSTKPNIMPRLPSTHRTMTPQLLHSTHLLVPSILSITITRVWSSLLSSRSFLARMKHLVLSWLPSSPSPSTRSPCAEASTLSSRPMHLFQSQSLSGSRTLDLNPTSP